MDDAQKSTWPICTKSTELGTRVQNNRKGKVGTEDEGRRKD